MLLLRRISITFSISTSLFFSMFLLRSSSLSTVNVNSLSFLYVLLSLSFMFFSLFPLCSSLFSFMFFSLSFLYVLLSFLYVLLSFLYVLLSLFPLCSSLSTSDLEQMILNKNPSRSGYVIIKKNLNNIFNINIFIL